MRVVDVARCHSSTSEELTANQNYRQGPVCDSRPKVWKMREQNNDQRFEEGNDMWKMACKGVTYDVG